MSRSLAICNLKDNGSNTVATTTLPTVEEVLYEETPPPVTSPPRTLSPAANIISPQSTHRSQSPKRSVIGSQFTNNNVSLSSYDAIGQQNFSAPKSAGGSSQLNNSHTYKQTNGTIVNENGDRSPTNTQTTSKTINTQQGDASTDRLLKEYQKSRAEVIRQFDEHEVRKNELQKQLAATNPKIRAINDVTKYDSLEDIARSPAFTPLVCVEDAQAIRAIDIHPTGKYFAVGSNSKMLRICAYPDTKNIRTDSVTKPATILYKKAKHHLGSIYCMGWSPSGRIIATGSNDKLIKLLRLNMDNLEDETTHTEIELTHHNGTIRDVIFMHDNLKDDSILLSGGAGDCKVYVTDVKKQTTIKSYSGHQGHIYSLFAWDACSFVSGSQDGTSRLWDIRQPECVNVIASRPSNSAVAAVAVDGSGQLLATGYEDATCLLYDLRGKRVVQSYQPHANEIRSVRFSVHSYYLLTASYDKKVVMTSLSGDLTKALVLSNVAAHTDKIIQARWHPNEMSFATTSADRTCLVWAPPLSALSTLAQSP
jgi:WD40 repeat protein